MRFLLFNAIVGLALVYLLTGGEMPTAGGFRESVAAVQENAVRAAAQLKRELHVDDAPHTEAVVQADSSAKPEPKGYAKDVIPAPQSAPQSAPKSAPKPLPQPVQPKQTETPPPPPPAPGTKTVQTEPRPQVEPLPLPAAQSVAKRPQHVIDEKKALATPRERRRAEVLADGPVPSAGDGGRVALKEGTQMMSVRERRRQLDSLAEEMEMLYLEKVGG